MRFVTLWRETYLKNFPGQLTIHNMLLYCNLTQERCVIFRNAGNLYNKLYLVQNPCHFTSY